MGIRKQLFHAFAITHREAPVVMRILVLLVVVISLLIINVIWLSVAYSNEVSRLKLSHTEDISAVRKLHEAKVREKEAANLIYQKRSFKKHEEDVEKLSEQFSQELKKKIELVDQELESLKQISMEYWQIHIKNSN